MKKADLITGIVLLVLSVYVIQESWRMPQSATFGPGVGFLPLWLGVLLALFAVILFVGAWRRLATEKTEEPLFPRGKALVAVGLVLGGLAAYIMLIEVFGFIADTLLFVMFLLKIVEHQTWQRTIIVGVVTTGILFTIFQVLLKITLPSNMFGF